MHRLEKTFHYLEKTTGMILGDNLAPEKKKAHHLLWPPAHGMMMKKKDIKSLRNPSLPCFCFVFVTTPHDSLNYLFLMTKFLDAVPGIVHLLIPRNLAKAIP